ncbi:MAG: hypothetical protein V4654_08260 [Bdellovibrionota bacterium]
MKNVLMVGILSLTCISVFAKGETSKKDLGRKPATSWLKELNSETARVLEVLNISCPEKLSELMRDATSISKVFYGEKNNRNSTQWQWQIVGVKRNPGPFSSDETPVGTLVIDWQSKPNDPNQPIAADRPTGWNIKCSIEKPE